MRIQNLQASFGGGFAEQVAPLGRENVLLIQPVGQLLYRRLPPASQRHTGNQEPQGYYTFHTGANMHVLALYGMGTAVRAKAVPHPKSQNLAACGLGRRAESPK